MEKIICEQLNSMCAILANGLFPQSGKALGLLRSADYICCCDGAVVNLVAAGLEPNVIIGDGDSIPDELRERYADIFICIDEQDYNDLTKATRYCVHKGFRQITYFGATGLREDHTLGNIFLLPYYLKELNVEPIMVTDNGQMFALKGCNTIASYIGQQVSVFNIDCTSLSSDGLRWPISPFNQLWQGTLNESIGDRFSIIADGVYLLFLAI